MVTTAVEPPAVVMFSGPPERSFFVRGFLIAALSFGVGFAARGFLSPTPAPPSPVATNAQVPMVAPAVRKVTPGVELEAPAPEKAIEPTAPPPPPTLKVELAQKPEAVPSAEPGQKRITIPYQHLEGHAQRVIIDILINGRDRARVAVDTGAPGMVISAQLAERLGVLQKSEGRLLISAAGIGGTTAALLVVLDSLEIGEAKTEFVPVTVTDSMSNAWEGLLGMDFLAGYSVTIDSAAHQLVLTELPKQESTHPAGHNEAWWRATFHNFAGQRNMWKQMLVKLEELNSKSVVSAGGESESLKKMLAFARIQDSEAATLLARLERYAAANSVPLEWRRR